LDLGEKLPKLGKNKPPNQIAKGGKQKGKKKNKGQSPDPQRQRDPPGHKETGSTGSTLESKKKRGKKKGEKGTLKRGVLPGRSAKG